ncbi:hypothetical protein H4582DRAFT_2065247 [Lactarius indigo]|nr:hypothetical protein H4582DRAFT_2065247 [Lactarius indigo]
MAGVLERTEQSSLPLPPQPLWLRLAAALAKCPPFPANIPLRLRRHSVVVVVAGGWVHVGRRGVAAGWSGAGVVIAVNVGAIVDNALRMCAGGAAMWRCLGLQLQQRTEAPGQLEWVLWRLRDNGASEAVVWWGLWVRQKKRRGAGAKQGTQIVYIQDGYSVNPTSRLFSPYGRRPGCAATLPHWQVHHSNQLQRRAARHAPSHLQLRPPPLGVQHKPIKHNDDAAAVGCWQGRGGIWPTQPQVSTTTVVVVAATSSVLFAQAPQPCPTTTVMEGWNSARQSRSRTAFL